MNAFMGIGEKCENLHDLLVLKLQSLYDVEQELVKTLPKMIKHTSDEGLREAFERHLGETEEQVLRLEHALQELGGKVKESRAETIRALIDDAEWLFNNVESGSVLDVALAAAARQIEHYEIASYTSAKEWAETMSHGSVALLLSTTLSEEQAAHDTLHELSGEYLNARAHDVEGAEIEEEAEIMD